MQRNHGQPISYSLLMQGWSDTVSQEPSILAFTTRTVKTPSHPEPLKHVNSPRRFCLIRQSLGRIQEDSPQSQTRFGLTMFYNCVTIVPWYPVLIV